MGFSPNDSISLINSFFALSILSCFFSSAFSFSFANLISSSCFFNAIISSFSSTGLVSVIGFSPKDCISSPIKLALGGALAFQ